MSRPIYLSLLIDLLINESITFIQRFQVSLALRRREHTTRPRSKRLTVEFETGLDTDERLLPTEEKITEGDGDFTKIMDLLTIESRSPRRIRSIYVVVSTILVTDI